MFLNIKMLDKSPCLYIFQNENENQNIWDKNFSCKPIATKQF